MADINNIVKRAALITIHCGRNFGSVLQTVATVEVLKRHRVDTIVLDYRPERVLHSRYFKGSLASIKTMIAKLLYFPFILFINQRYSSYLKRHCKLSKVIKPKDNFIDRIPDVGILITGSDQVWNTTHNEGFDDHYVFKGVDTHNRKKIALSSSFGKEELTPEEKKYFEKELSSYDAISVREQSAVGILSELGIEAVQLVDPTFMLDKDEWVDFSSKPIVDQPYVLIYTPYNTRDKRVIVESARFLASKFGLKTVTFSWVNKDDPDFDKTVKYATPGDFLSLMLGAKYVITNSFHGTAFSLNLNKQFWVYHPSAFSTRIDSILSLTGQTSRLKEKPLCNDDITKIDFEEVNRVLDAERKKVDAFLNANL